jgi:hypothetical protein
MTRAAVLVVLSAFAASACTSVPRNSSEAAWARGQCDQIIDKKMQEKCLERVEKEYGAW